MRSTIRRRRAAAVLAGALALGAAGAVASAPAAGAQPAEPPTAPMTVRPLDAEVGDDVAVSGAGCVGADGAPGTVDLAATAGDASSQPVATQVPAEADGSWAFTFTITEWPGDGRLSVGAWCLVDGTIVLAYDAAVVVVPREWADEPATLPMTVDAVDDGRFGNRVSVSVRGEGCFAPGGGQAEGAYVWVVDAATGTVTPAEDHYAPVSAEGTWEATFPASPWPPGGITVQAACFGPGTVWSGTYIPVTVAEPRAPTPPAPTPTPPAPAPPGPVPPPAPPTGAPTATVARPVPAVPTYTG